jgi:RHS repeat-associated protein
VAVINDGSPQRSMVDSVTVIFPGAVTLSAGAITLYNTTGSYAESITYTNPSSDGKTWLVSFTGGNIAAGSLPNGVYDLVVHHADVSGITLSADVTWAFHCLFGDIDGNGTVDSADSAVFDEDYSSAYYGPTYDPAFDATASGRDFNTAYSAFLGDYGTTLTYTPTGAPFLTVPAAGSSALGDITPWANVTNALYYSTQDQVLETRANGTVTSQSVWGLDYVNDLVAYDTNAASGSLGISGSGLGQRLYAQHDANYDMTSLTDTTGTVVERYMYDPYGNVTVLNPDGTVRGDGTLASSHFGVPNLFQGMRYDSVTGLYNTPNRDLNPVTGTWMEQDPAGYVDGANVYQGFDGKPTSGVDPRGLDFGTGAADPGPQPAALKVGDDLKGSVQGTNGRWDWEVTPALGKATNSVFAGSSEERFGVDFGVSYFQGKSCDSKNLELIQLAHFTDQGKNYKMHPWTGSVYGWSVDKLPGFKSPFYDRDRDGAVNPVLGNPGVAGGFATLGDAAGVGPSKHTWVFNALDLAVGVDTNKIYDALAWGFVDDGGKIYWGAPRAEPTSAPFITEAITAWNGQGPRIATPITAK